MGNNYCERHEWPADHGEPCPDCAELGALRSLNAEFRADKEALIEQRDKAYAEKDVALLQVDELKRRLKSTIEMPIQPCCKRLLQATFDGIDNIHSGEKPLQGPPIQLQHAKTCPCQACESHRKWHCPTCDTLMSSLESTQCVEGHDRYVQKRNDEAKPVKLGWCPGCGGLVHPGECETH